MLKQRPLGNTGLSVSELALGGLFIGEYGNGFEEGKAAITRAVELGVNFIDTAPGYSDSESVLGKVLPELDTPVQLSTKLGYKPEPYEPRNAEFIRAALAASLDRLNRDCVDVLFIHEPDRPDIMDWWEGDPTFQGPVNDILQEALDKGQAKHVGVGGTTVYEMGHVLETGRYEVLLTAFNFDLLYREAEHHLLPLTAKHGMGVVVGSPLHQGMFAKAFTRTVAIPPPWLSPPRQKQLQALYEWANDQNASLPELSIRFALSYDQVSTVLMGARSVAEVEANVASAEKGPLSSTQLRELNDLAAMVPFRPYQEPLGLPFFESEAALEKSQG